jgi:hypothetical protein
MSSFCPLFYFFILFFFLLVLVAPPNPGAISPSSIVFFLVSFFCPSQPRSYISFIYSVFFVSVFFFAPLKPGAIYQEGKKKLKRKKTIDEGDIAPGLGGATKTNKKKNYR